MRRLSSFSLTLVLVLFILALAPPAAADHTDPRTPLAPTDGLAVTGIVRGEGTWQHIANFPGLASEALTGGGTDLEFFSPYGSTDVFGAFGTLGQDEAGSVGQRILQLTQGGEVSPRWVADHGSAHCQIDNTSVTGLQHDSQVGSVGRITLLTDTTDALGRCHDPDGGGIEIVDVSGIADPAFEPREVHLVRFAGFSHTHTIDTTRPWIVYNSSSDFAGRPWIDVMDMHSCFGTHKWTLDKRRAECRPSVSRIAFEPEWTMQRDQNTGELESGSAACHDITFADDRLYCAGVNASLIIDVSGMFRGQRVQGTAFPCPVVDGTDTGADVTDCGGMGADRTEAARGWTFLGTFQHPGRDCGPPGTDIRTCNSNNQVRSDDGVAISHEADPTADHRFMFVTDERGGGVVPPGSSCSPGIDNPFGNGGAHAFDISDPSNIHYATTPDGAKAVYISDAVVPAETFCDIHVIEHVPGEQRFIAAYYTQGIKIVDYFVDGSGNIQFRETSSFTLPNANTWAAEDFKIVDNPDGTRTYFMAADDIHRGIDVLSWTGTPNPTGAQAPAASSGATATNLSLLGVAGILLPIAALVGRRRAAGREVTTAG
ncbi:MAG: hypothetical protein ACRDGW_06750 [Actinomycetota bacterium]